MPPTNASQCVNMDSEERTETMHNLDMKYRQATHDCDLVVKNEETRRLKLRSMVLRDETSGVKDQLAQRDLRVKELVAQIDDVRSQLDSAQEKSRRQDNLMQSQAREITNLKEELSAFNAVSQDSAKVLSEKLALSREVAVLKPELEHLRSQLAHQKDVLAEKLALERQLSTLEVELANERRAAEKAAQRQDGDNEVEEDLRNQVRELEKELAKGKRLAEKNLKSHENKNSEAEGELQTLREQLATVEESLTAEKRRAEQLAKAKSNTTSEMQEEMEELRQGLEEAQKALAAEKRAAQRQVKREAESASDEELTQLREELAEARAELEGQAKAQEKLRKENEQAQVDAEERQQAAFDKVDRLRSKLRDAQDELKKCRTELEKAQKAQERAAKVSTVATTTVPLKSAGAKANAKKKRSADEMSVDDKVLLTPGMDDRPKRPLKKRGFDLSMVGGKSEFSITPFLNKTHNPDGSPKPTDNDTTPTAAVQSRRAEEATTAEPTAEEPAAEEPAAEEQTPEEPAAVESSATKPASATKLVEKRPRGRPRTKPLSDSSPSKKNLTARNRKAPRVESTLDKVTEEAEEGDSSTNQDQENRAANNASPAAKPTSTSVAASLSSIPEKAEPKKKKRKLLGANPSTLFDGGEDEGEKVKPTATAAATTKRPPSAKAAGAKASGKGPSAARFGAGVKNAFAGASFSPLKKERRGVAASFLA
ncbi:uncharacterized protein B0H64DRAFT_200795 [Chaetomium fimeti]|uniref:Uncharacterized protein n=1 Tax=Chaetomium fimeti TaxID=1854472 RepID=A0AAE0HEF2_9PEZI|nr:hypothetical protein B0H64DRAFT_200795 [Chaetomium fimeti]